MNNFSTTVSGGARAASWLLAAMGLGLIAWVISGDVRIAGGPGIGFTEAVVFSLGFINILIAFFSPGRVATFLMVQLSLGLTLLLAEFVLQITLAHRYFAPFKLEERYLYDLVPSVKREHRGLPINGGPNIYQVNAQGFRGEELKRESTVKHRVVVYGDSFIHAEYTVLENTFVRQLQQRLEKQLGAPVEVINAGVAGYGPDQAVRRIEDELSWLQPDLVVLAVFTGNDYGDLVRNKIYRLGPDGALLENNYSFSDEILLNAKLEQTEFVIKRIAREAAYALIVMLKPERPDFDTQAHISGALQQHLDEYHEFIVENDNVIRLLRSDPYSADISILPESPSSIYKVGLMNGIVQKAGNITEQAGVPFLLLGIPHPMDVLEGEAESGSVNRDLYPKYDADKLSGTLQAIAKRHDIAHVNLLQHFREVDKPASLYLKGGDDHWNDAGQSYAAEIVGERILSAGWLSGN